MRLQDQAIIEAIKLGSEKVLFALYDELRREFVSWVLKNHELQTEEALDLFQDTIIDFHNNVKDGKFAATSSVKTYLFAIGKNKIRNYLRKKQSLSTDALALDPVVELPATTDPRIEKVMQAIQQIGEKCRQVLLMYYEKGFDMQSIAINMGYKNANVAKKKKHECLKKLEEESIHLIKTTL